MPGNAPGGEALKVIWAVERKNNMDNRRAVPYRNGVLYFIVNSFFNQSEDRLNTTMSFYLLPIFNFTDLYKKSQQFLRGFFLLEVCCALALFVCVMSGMAHVIVHSLQTVHRAQVRMEAFLTARSYAEKLCMQKKEGVFDFADAGYTIHGEVVRDKQYACFCEVTVWATCGEHTRMVRTGYVR